jgi:Trp operon repressor
MPLARRVLLLALVVGVCGTALGRAQGVATPTQAALTPPEMEDFLLRARIGATKRTLKGATGARQVTLSDGRVTHDAQVQDVDIYKPIFEAGKYTETNFRDTYRYNVAGYRLSRLLGLHNVPVSVLRTVNGKPAAVTWWIDDAMDEADRQKKKPVPYGPDAARNAGYFHILRVFDELIQNRDRNPGNMMWTQDWTFWMVDHTRAFRLGRNLLKPEALERCERTLLEGMRRLTRPALREAMVRALTNDEIDALLARRDVIVKLFDGLIAQRGEATVLFTQPPRP